IANLLAQFEILTAQRGNLTPKLRHLSTQLSDQPYPVAGVRFLPARFEKKAIHGPNKLPISTRFRKDRLNVKTGSAKVYPGIGGGQQCQMTTRCQRPEHL